LSPEQEMNIDIYKADKKYTSTINPTDAFKKTPKQLLKRTNSSNNLKK
jgi:hypothetical protein